MLECIGSPCIEMLDIPCRSDSPVAIIFIFSDEIINSTMIFYASAYSCTLIDSSGVRVGAGGCWSCNWNNYSGFFGGSSEEFCYFYKFILGYVTIFQ